MIIVKEYKLFNLDEYDHCPKYILSVSLVIFVKENRSRYNRDIYSSIGILWKIRILNLGVVAEKRDKRKRKKNTIELYFLSLKKRGLR